MKKTHIFLVDDHEVVRQGISFVFKSHFPGVELSQASNFHQLLQLLSSVKPDLILLDINIPGGNSPDMIPKIRAIHSDVKILIFSAYEEDFLAFRYIKAGVNGYLNKNEDETTIVRAVTKVLDTGRFISPRMKEIIIQNTLDETKSEPLESLSNREMEVARMLVKGMGNIEICNALHIHISTVSTYKKRIFEKLKVDNVVSLVKVFDLYE